MDKKLQLLGMARRAGKLAMGHDMALDSVRQGDAALVLLCSDVSDRLREEFTRAACQAKVPFISMSYPMDTLHHATGYRAGVAAVNDKGFAERLTQLFLEEKKEGNL